MSGDYQPSDYWTSLLEQQFDARGVAYPDMPLAFNRAMYRAHQAGIERLLHDHRVQTRTRVLDIGAGTGIWVQFWLDHGATAVTGVDLTQPAVEGLRGRFPKLTFIASDIGDASFEADGRFGLVSAMNVLLHITDDERWAQAWQNIGRSLERRGFAVLIEPLLAHGWNGSPFDSRSNSKARSAAQYEQAALAAEMQILDVRPASALFANPIDSRSRTTHLVMEKMWGAGSRLIAGRDRLARGLCALAWPIDRALCRLPNGPSGKLILLRKN